MSKSQSALALQLRRRERGALKIADRWAAADEAAHPHWLGNLRIYQGLMARAAAERSTLLLAYVARRQARVAP